MSTKVPNPTRITVDSDNAVSTFELTTTAAEETECAAPECHHAPAETHDLRLNLPMRKGLDIITELEVGFCSLECAQAFKQLFWLAPADDGDAGFQVLYIAANPLVAEVVVEDDSSEPIHVLGEDFEAAASRANEILSEYHAAHDGERNPEIAESYSVSYHPLGSVVSPTPGR